MRTLRMQLDKTQPFWQHGAFVLWLSRRMNRAIRIEWDIPTTHWHLNLHWREGDSGNDIHLSFACGAFAVWFTIKRVLRNRGHDPLMPRKIGISIHDNSIWWSVWQPVWEWSSRHPWWWGGSINVVDILLGAQKYSTESGGHEYGTVRMPEGEYPCLIEFEHARWKRPRWPFDLRITRAIVTPHTPIPVPGKGTTSYNCGEDAIHSHSAPAKTVGEAVASITKSVLSTRERYGGSIEWRPQQTT
jgi:hypothetical protein